MPRTPYVQSDLTALISGVLAMGALKSGVQHTDSGTKRYDTRRYVQQQ